MAAPSVPPLRVPITRPQLGKAEADAAARVVRSRWVIQGPEVTSFENELAAAVNAPHAIAVSSGTAALELSLRVLGVGPGDEVLTASHSFIATANSITAVGARPVFVDVERDTFGINPALCESALSPRVKAILCVHQLGMPCDIAPLMELCKRTGLPLIEDAACALGSELELDSRWERIGRPHGVLACFSFHPRKIITTGDGGMITTADGSLAQRLRLLRQHAMSVSTEARDKDPLAAESYLEPGFNHRMTDLQAAIGRPQLARLDTFITDRRRLAAGYAGALEGHPVLEAPAERGNVRTNWQSYPALLREDAGMSQEDVLRFFYDRGIACRRGVSNAHQEPAYAKAGSFRSGPLPVSEYLRQHTVMLPLFHGMTKDEDRTVRAAIAELRRTR